MALSFVFLSSSCEKYSGCEFASFCVNKLLFFQQGNQPITKPKVACTQLQEKKLHSNIFVVFRSPQFSQKFQIVVEANSSLQSIYKVAKITVIVFLKSFLQGDSRRSCLEQIQYHQRCVSNIETLAVKTLFQRPEKSVRTLFCWKKSPYLPQR